MKLLFPTTVFASLALVESACSHGKLYISDADSTTIHVFDVSGGGDLSNLTPETTITAPGAAGVNLAATGSRREISTIYRGTADVGYTDGTVAFVDTGVTTESHGDHYDFSYLSPSIIDNASFDCARAIHYVPHDDRIAIFCDGSFDVSPKVNSTIWIIDETLFGADGSAIVYSATLEGSHHGVAVPVDDGHILHSLATPDRIAGVEGATSLPSTFQVIDFDGNILHSINNESSADTSCSGFHGEVSHGNTFTLACDATHGGILIVDYDPSSETYTSRALEYPEEYEEQRTGSLVAHSANHHIVGNFAGNDEYYLLAFEDSEQELTSDHVFPLEASQCAYGYEMGSGQVVLIFHPTGVLQAVEYKDGAWTEIAEATVVEGMTACTDFLFIPGVQQYFVVDITGNTLYAVDLEHVEEGEMEVYTSQLSFTAFAGVVSGVPDEIICTSADEEDDDHDHDDEGEENDDEESGVPPAMPSKIAVTGLLLLALANLE